MPCKVCRRTLLKSTRHAVSNQGAKMEETANVAIPFNNFIQAAEAGCDLCNFLVTVMQSYDNSPSRSASRQQRHNAYGDLWDANSYIRPVLEKTDCDISASGPQEICTRLRFSVRNRVAQFLLAGNVHGFPGRHVADHPDLNLASQWIKQCGQLHQKCPRFEDKDLPTRLIDVGSLHEQPRLVHTAGQRDSSGRYVALSHCWGSSSPPKTDRNNVNSGADIPFHTLPKTFRDAVSVVRNLGLGIRYLWIDCFCIIQGNDDVAKADWERECASMHSTFANAGVVICGPSAVGCNAGFLDRRASSVSAPRMEIDLNELNDEWSGKLSILEEKDPRKDLMGEDSALAKRGWIIQERLLSSRVLYFGKAQMYMECASADFYEDCCIPVVAEEYPFSKAQLTTGDEEDELFEEWRTIVEEYSKCSLTKGNDRLPALSGTATRLKLHHGSAYHAGLWQLHLVRGLVWQRFQSAGTLSGSGPALNCKVVPTVKAPSWSWVSCNYGVEYVIPYEAVEEHAVMHEVSSPAVGLDPCGQVDRDHAYLVIEGHLHDACVSLRSPVGTMNPDPDREVYAANELNSAQLFGRMRSDDPWRDPDANVIRIAGMEYEKVTLLLLAAEYGLDDDVYEWNAMVLRQASAPLQHRARAGSARVYHRIGLFHADSYPQSPDPNFEENWNRILSSNKQVITIV